MIKQTIFFTMPVRLSLKNSQMVISFRDSPESVTRPIEDIGCVLLENQQISITLPLLNELTRNNVAVIVCDNRAMPASMLMPLEANTTQAESIKAQVAASEPTKKQAWKQIIEAKIRNQVALLDRYDKDAAALRPLYANVKSGDADNREGQAARIYWNRLLGDDFRRSREGDHPNPMLNYGYAILRAATARALLGSGLFPQFGIFHKNRYNAFPLADDVMEPYRPYVDDIVYSLCCDGLCELDKEVKAELLRVLTCDVRMDKVTRPLQIALTMTTASLVKLYAGETKKLALPAFQ